MNAVVRGAKGGGSQPHAATEAPDSLHSIAYARILDLVSEGEIQGFAHPTNPLQDIYLDSTPLANADGSLNFQNVQVDSRSGTQTQTVLTGFPDVENETAVNVELKSTADWTQAITDLSLSALRVLLSVPALSQSNTSTGDITGYSVQYEIDLQTDGGSWQTMLTSAFTGKTTSKYERSHRIDLPAATSGWTIRVHRITANQNLATIADTVMIESYTEIVDAKFAYPNSAVIGLIIDASQFSSIPQRAYNLLGRIVSVPSNYNPTTRVYTGTWDGTFQPAWTDNPAWIFYDLATNLRYGLGRYISAAQVNKWNLYSIAQYCDGMVSDGMGGQEPRFTCSLFLQQQADAYKVLQDLAAVFRGISFWGAGTINAVADMPGDPVYTYTAANVLGGKFTYQGSSKTTRYTVALVSWNDPNDMGRAKVEFVPDRDGIARYGVNITQVTATGATSRGQAQRVGLWTLLTSRLETETVTFGVGLDGTIAAPGQIVRIADPARAGKRQAGRISAATATAITVDSAPTVAVGDNLTCTLPTGVTETHAVTAVAGNVISVAAPGFTQVPPPESVWVTESATLAAQAFRVVSVAEDQSGQNLGFTITALAHNASKFAAIDSGAPIVLPTITAIPPSVQPAPASVTITSSETAGAVLSSVLLTIQWPATDSAVRYRCEYRRDNGDWQILGSALAGLSIDIPNAKPGTYVARVSAINASGIGSVQTISNAFVVADQTKQPTTVTAIQTTANTANNTANTATQLANQVNVQNPGFDAGDVGWNKDPGWSIKTDGAGPGQGPGYAQFNPTGADGAIKNQALCFVTVGQVYKAQALIRATGANGSAYVKIAWLDTNLNVVGTNVPGNVVTGTTTAGSFVSAPAPAGAVYGQVWIEVDGCTVGSYQADNVVSNLQASSLSEVPDGNGRYAAVYNAATQTGMYQPGANLFPNPSGALGFKFGPYIFAWIGGSQQSMGTSPPDYGGAIYSQQGPWFDCHPGTSSVDQGFSVTIPAPQTTYTLSADMDARVIASGAMFVEARFLNSSGAEISSAVRLTVTAVNGQITTRYSGTAAAPAGTTQITVLVRFTGAMNSPAVCEWRRIKLEIGNTATPFSDEATQFGNQLTNPGSGQTIGDQRNLVSSITRSLGLTRSATALTAQSTGAVNVNAHTVTLGEASIPYNAVTNAVTGLTVGDSYYIYTHDNYAGSTQTWLAGTDQNTVNSYDDAYNAGVVTIPSSGSSGGGGGGGGVNNCVGADMYLRPGLTARQLAERWRWWRPRLLRGQDGWHFVRRRPRVVAQPCCRITVADGSTLDCSLSTPVTVRTGDSIQAPMVYGHDLWTDSGWQRVVNVELLAASRDVVRICVGGHSFLAGANPYHRIDTHNVWKP